MEPLDRYLLWIQTQRNLSPDTVQKYATCLRRLQEWLTVPLAEASKADLDTFVSELGGAPSTVAGRMAAIRSFFRYLARLGLRPDDPSVVLQAPKRDKNLPRPIHNVDEVLALLDPQTKAIATFLLETGLRISEACAVKLTPPAPDALMVKGKGRKDRLLPLTGAARAALDELGGEIPIGVRAVQKRLKKAFDGVTPHRFRHTFGTSLGTAGTDLGVIQDLMGHANPATTRGYTAYDLQRFREALARRGEPQT